MEKDAGLLVNDFNKAKSKVTINKRQRRRSTKLKCCGRTPLAISFDSIIEGIINYYLSSQAEDRSPSEALRQLEQESLKRNKLLKAAVAQGICLNNCGFKFNLVNSADVGEGRRSGLKLG
jgi:endonuclease III